MKQDDPLAKLFVTQEKQSGSELIDFPDPRTYDFFPQAYITDDEFYYFTEVIAFGGALSVENLRRAYRIGVFPWAVGSTPTPWYCPEKRAILEFENLYIPRSLRKAQKKSDLIFTIDAAFSDVIENCARIGRKRPDETDGGKSIVEFSTWITDEFIHAFIALHESGSAHSVEAWDTTGNLVGGLYGVDAGGAFCGESMFHHSPNASKLCFLHLVEHLSAGGAKWLDIQMMTPHFELLGAHEITRLEFLDKLEKTLAQRLKLF
ncbi:MAG: leucyl/phenylalanyl-tRNA--protein transferase [Pyrinomonadaceae bacterium]